MGKSDVMIGMEAIGHDWLSVYEHLTEQKYDVRVIYPIGDAPSKKSGKLRQVAAVNTKITYRIQFCLAAVDFYLLCEEQCLHPPSVPVNSHSPLYL